MMMAIMMTMMTIMRRKSACRMSGMKQIPFYLSVYSQFGIYVSISASRYLISVEPSTRTMTSLTLHCSSIKALYATPLNDPGTPCFS